MASEFGKEYWEQHWQQANADRSGSMGGNPPNPYLDRELSHLVPGTALDAGCGTAAEASWLALRGWQVTAADISAQALARAAERAAASGASERIQWVEADLSVWDPGTRFDLVTTFYAHPAMPQLEFYDRIAGWVAPGGTLLIVGHLHTAATDDGHGRGHGRGHGHGQGHGQGHGHGQGAGHHPPAAASATAAAITRRLDAAAWQVVTAEELHRTLVGPGGAEVPLNDVVVRATRRH
ncbi:class I SAM-dependent methyltransferase [Natronosporangium hydrolyticum]|uniref:Class I SAM-dependent methyltransferase n=1 Tax=Natronosporangium hydrolyticum TaxID=2811111 RepID=A0A895YID6_9ACTN|nr:class I SAM-dependent methyltransferase [Natronosporangium hydrolyticum]QSB15123.1 class I SAM-dependent methyltransferase [Natronosporangium hydrolyticum]